MKTCKILLLLIPIFILGGCSGTSPQQPERIVTVVDTQIVKVPTKCTRPKLDCDFRGKGAEPISKLLECVILQKKIIDECTVEAKN